SGQPATAARAEYVSARTGPEMAAAKPAAGDGAGHGDRGDGAPGAARDRRGGLPERAGEARSGRSVGRGSGTPDDRAGQDANCASSPFPANRQPGTSRSGVDPGPRGVGGIWNRPRPELAEPTPVRLVARRATGRLAARIRRTAAVVVAHGAFAIKPGRSRGGADRARVEPDGRGL